MQKTAVLQAFFEFTERAIDALMTALRSAESDEEGAARTLSRPFWQRKNFRAQRPHA
jgi:hypothetical protein